MPSVDRIRTYLGWLSRLLDGKRRAPDQGRDVKAANRSIYDQIREQIDANPSLVQLDLTQLSEIHKIASGLEYAPGAWDALFGARSKDETGSRQIRLVISAINAGEIREWQAVEERVAAVQAAPNIDNLLGELTLADVSDRVQHLFVQVALNSRNFEAVKWGIEIGGIRLSRAFADKLIVLARHPEFTSFVSFVFLRESERHPEFKQLLVQLLPVSYQWGVVTLIGYIVRDQTLISQTAVQRDILVYGTENNGGILMEVAFTIAHGIDVRYFMNEALENGRTRSAIIWLMNTLLMEPQPLGGILDLKNGREVFGSYLEFLQKTPTDILTLYSLWNLEYFLGDDGTPWADRVEKLNDVKAEFEARFNIGIIRSALHDERIRWIALNLIRDLKLSELRGDIIALFESNPSDFSTVAVLCEVGKREDIGLMLRRMRERMALDARAKRHMSHVNVHGEERSTGLLYALVIGALWKSPDPATVEHLKIALKDYDPAVRSAACHSVSKLPLDEIDIGIRELVRERLSDSPDYVRRAARDAATAIGMEI